MPCVGVHFEVQLSVSLTRSGATDSVVREAARDKPDYGTLPFSIPIARMPSMKLLAEFHQSTFK